MRTFTRIENISDTAHADNIVSALNKIALISNIRINIEDQLISFDCPSERCRFAVAKRLRELTRKSPSSQIA